MRIRIDDSFLVAAEKVSNRYYRQDFPTDERSDHKKSREPYVARLTHGVMHATRVAFYILPLVNLYRSFGDEQALLLTGDDVNLLRAIALFHDVSRENKEGKCNEKSACELETYLKSTGFTCEQIEIAKKAIMANKSANIFEKIFGDAEKLDIIRTKFTFELDRLDFYNDHKHNSYAIERIKLLAFDVRKLIAKQFDLKSDTAICAEKKQLFGPIGKTRDPKKKIKYEHNPCYALILKDVTEDKELYTLKDLYNNNTLFIPSIESLKENRNLTLDYIYNIFDRELKEEELKVVSELCSAIVRDEKLFKELTYNRKGHCGASKISKIITSAGYCQDDKPNFNLKINERIRIIITNYKIPIYVRITCIERLNNDVVLRELLADKKLLKEICTSGCDLSLMSVKDEKQIDQSILTESQQDGIPTLIQNGNEYLIYGDSKGDRNWKFTKITSDIPHLKDLPFENRRLRRSDEKFTTSLINTLKEGHTPSINEYHDQIILSLLNKITRIIPSNDEMFNNAILLLAILAKNKSPGCDLSLMSVEDEKQIDQSILTESQQDGIPILIQKGNEYLIYGDSKGDGNWQFTKITSDISYLKDLPFENRRLRCSDEKFMASLINTLKEGHTQSPLYRYRDKVIVIIENSLKFITDETCYRLGQHVRSLMNILPDKWKSELESRGFEFIRSEFEKKNHLVLSLQSRYRYKRQIKHTDSGLTKIMPDKTKVIVNVGINVNIVNMVRKNIQDLRSRLRSFENIPMQMIDIIQGEHDIKGEHDIIGSLISLPKSIIYKILDYVRDPLMTQKEAMLFKYLIDQDLIGQHGTYNFEKIRKEGYLFSGKQLLDRGIVKDEKELSVPLHTGNHNTVFFAFKTKERSVPYYVYNCKIFEINFTKWMQQNKKLTYALWSSEAFYPYTVEITVSG